MLTIIALVLIRTRVEFKKNKICITTLQNKNLPGYNSVLVRSTEI